MLDKYTPNFIWKNANALLDYGLIIEKELPYIIPQRAYEETRIVGSNRNLHEWLGDYSPYDLEIENISIPCKNLIDVKKWLLGEGEVITHNDPDKYIQAICSMAEPIQFENEWGAFYNFSLTFRCEPLKKKVRDIPVSLKNGTTVFFDDGDETAAPFLEIDSKSGPISIIYENQTFNILDSKVGKITIDNELGICEQNGERLRTKGEWLKITPGRKEITLSGGIASGKLYKRSVYL